MNVRDTCLACGSTRYKRNGYIHNGRQNHHCQASGRQFVADSTDRSISYEQRTLIEHLWRQRVSLLGICRTAGVSLPWRLHFMVECFAACRDHLHVQLPNHPTDVVIRRLEAEADETWSFVQKGP